MSIKQKTMSPYIKKPFKQMGKDYTKYKADELLNDDYFLQSDYIRQKIIGSFGINFSKQTTLFPKRSKSLAFFLKA